MTDERTYEAARDAELDRHHKAVAEVERGMELEEAAHKSEDFAVALLEVVIEIIIKFGQSQDMTSDLAPLIRTLNEYKDEIGNA
jgi:hypothetical protein